MLEPPIVLSRISPPCRGFPTPFVPAAPTFVFAVDCGFGKPKWCRSHATGHQRDLRGSMDELFTRLCRRVTVCRPVRLHGQTALLTRTRRKCSFLTMSLYLELASGCLWILFDALLLDSVWKRIIVRLVSSVHFTMSLLSDCWGVVINFAISNPMEIS